LSFRQVFLFELLFFIVNREKAVRPVKNLTAEKPECSKNLPINTGILAANCVSFVQITAFLIFTF